MNSTINTKHTWKCQGESDCFIQLICINEIHENWQGRVIYRENDVMGKTPAIQKMNLSDLKTSSLKIIIHFQCAEASLALDEKLPVSNV